MQLHQITTELSAKFKLEFQAQVEKIKDEAKFNEQHLISKYETKVTTLQKPSISEEHLYKEVQDQKDTVNSL
jgi:hypothetical protein